MVEDVPVTVQLHDAAVVVAAVEHGFIGRFISVDVHIAIADDYAAILETLSGMLAGGVAQFVLMNGWYGVLCGTNFANGRASKYSCLESVPFNRFAGQNDDELLTAVSACG